MQPALRTRSRFYFPGHKLLVALPLIALPVAAAADLASVALVKVAVPDDAAEAARAGSMAVQFDKSLTPQTASIAFRAASDVAELHRMRLDPEGFTVHTDGSVELTATRSAPTLLFKRLPGLRNLVETSETVTVHRATW